MAFCTFPLCFVMRVVTAWRKMRSCALLTARFDNTSDWSDTLDVSGPALRGLCLLAGWQLFQGSERMLCSRCNSWRTATDGIAWGYHGGTVR